MRFLKNFKWPVKKKLFTVENMGKKIGEPLSDYHTAKDTAERDLGQYPCWSSPAPDLLNVQDVETIPQSLQNSAQYKCK